MDTRKGKLNIIVSLVFQTITMFLAIFAKRILIDFCGNDVNGLNALFTSIIGFLSVAELGVGHAITFCMYKPIVEGNCNQVSALFHLFQRLYTLIGGAVFLVGMGIMPFLPHLAKDYRALDVNVYFSFFLVLISTTATYSFSANTALINAYKNNYITTAITQGGIVFQYVLQIIVLYFSHSFTAYLACRTIAVFAQWAVTALVTKGKYAYIAKNHAKLNMETQGLVKKNIRAMFIHKIGYALVNTLDGVVISAFVGVVVLGEYSNYTMILSSMTSVISLIFTSLVSVVGHLYAQEDKTTSRNYFETFHFMNFIIGTIFYLGYYAVIDELIALLFSADLIVSRNISYVITINGFIRFMRQSVLTFKDASGTFYQDRWKPLVEGIINISLSILLVNLVGVSGVLLATIITNLLICHIVEPYVLYKHAFLASPRYFYLKNYGMIFVFGIVLSVMDHCLWTSSSVVKQLLVNGTISIVLSTIVCGTVLLMNKKQRRHLFVFLRRDMS